MKAMILAAGRGERMRPLSEHQPKPMLSVAGKPLLQYHIEALVKAGIRDLVINHAVMGEMIEAYFGNGNSLDARIQYSAEGSDPLETGGGIKQALPMLGDAPFIVVNADIWTDYDFSSLAKEPEGIAHLVLVKNPQHHPQGDFCLSRGTVENSGGSCFTYSGIGVYRPELFREIQERAFPLTPLLRAAVEGKQVSGELHGGQWFDIGTPQRLELLRKKLE